MSSQKILVVDDDISVGTLLKIALEDMYDVATTTSALTAFKYLTKNKVDLVLLDIVMPHIDGMEALREIKNKHPDTIIVMLTTYASRENKQQARTLGAYDIISKPFELDELHSYVDRVLSKN